ncbi:MAG: SDR family NAD(P)-dependent oxidoreductase [Rickettsiales bacterium]|nr:SDR family NAD(P)-dependent oxidoreductase [Rickettsiales bacterium]
MPSESLKNRIALITGASRGIGQAVAIRFAQEGAHVILVARDVKGLEATDDAIRAIGGNATLVPMDLSDSSLIELLAQQIAERYGKLDILVGNAGLLGELTPMPHLAPDIWQQTLDVNLTANFQLIRCFDALLKQSDAPRALFVTSGVASRLPAYWGIYAVSKAALDALVKVYAAENINSALRINLISPGEVRTRMHAQAFPGADPETYAPPDAVTDVFVRLASPACTDHGKIHNAQ